MTHSAVIAHLAAQPARRFDFGERFECRHFGSERGFEKSNLPRVRLHGVDPAYHGWNRLGVHRDLDRILAGGVKAKHATSRIDGASLLVNRASFPPTVCLRNQHVHDSSLQPQTINIIKINSVRRRERRA